MYPFDSISDSIIMTSLFTSEKVKHKQLRIPMLFCWSFLTTID